MPHMRNPSVSRIDHSAPLSSTSNDRPCKQEIDRFKSLGGHGPKVLSGRSSVYFRTHGPLLPQQPIKGPYF